MNELLPIQKEKFRSMMVRLLVSGYDHLLNTFLKFVNCGCRLNCKENIDGLIGNAKEDRWRSFLMMDKDFDRDFFTGHPPKPDCRWCRPVIFP